MVRTWHLEWLAVATILAAVNVATHAPPIAWVGAAAVLLSFGHASVADRLAERQVLRSTDSNQTVACYRSLTHYLVGKEVLWVVYFLATRSYPALVGCGVFLVHPLWRRLYRRWRPLWRDSL